MSSPVNNNLSNLFLPSTPPLPPISLPHGRSSSSSLMGSLLDSPTKSNIHSPIPFAETFFQTFPEPLDIQAPATSSNSALDQDARSSQKRSEAPAQEPEDQVKTKRQRTTLEPRVSFIAQENGRFGMPSERLIIQLATLAEYAMTKWFNEWSNEPEIADQKQSAAQSKAPARRNRNNDIWSVAKPIGEIAKELNNRSNEAIDDRIAFIFSRAQSLLENKRLFTPDSNRHFMKFASLYLQNTKPENGLILSDVQLRDLHTVAFRKLFFLFSAHLQQIQKFSLVKLGSKADLAIIDLKKSYPTDNCFYQRLTSRTEDAVKSINSTIQADT